MSQERDDARGAPETLPDAAALDGPTIPDALADRPSWSAPDHRVGRPSQTVRDGGPPILAMRPRPDWRRLAPPVGAIAAGVLLVAVGVLTESSVWQGLAGLPGLMRDSVAHTVVALGAWQLVGLVDGRPKTWRGGVGAGVFVTAFLASVLLNFLMAPGMDELAEVAETEELLREGELVDARQLFADREVLCADAPRERAVGVIRRLHERGAVHVYADAPIVVGDVRVVEGLRIELPEEEEHRRAIRDEIQAFLGQRPALDDDERFWTIPCGSPD